MLSENYGVIQPCGKEKEGRGPMRTQNTSLPICPGAVLVQILCFAPVRNFTNRVVTVLTFSGFQVPHHFNSTYQH